MRTRIFPGPPAFAAALVGEAEVSSAPPHAATTERRAAGRKRRSEFMASSCD
jgi:hypothetical protein